MSVVVSSGPMPRVSSNNKSHVSLWTGSSKCQEMLLCSMVMVRIKKDFIKGYTYSSNQAAILKMFFTSSSLFDYRIFSGGKCKRKLNCGVHTCQDVCHPDDCKPCSKTSVQSCSCGKAKEPRPCSSPEFKCGEKCGKLLSCSHHSCDLICHKVKFFKL